jgi:hypothetical protein
MRTGKLYMFQHFVIAIGIGIGIEIKDRYRYRKLQHRLHAIHPGVLSA